MSTSGVEGHGILFAAAGSLCAAAYLVAFRAATALASAHALVLPLLMAGAVLGSLAAVVESIASRRPRVNRSSLVAALVLGPLTALGSEAMARALTLISVGPAAVILRSQVLFVALAGWWLLGERVSLRFWLGVVTALAGLILLQGGGGVGVRSLSGMLWALTAALAFAAMQVVVRRGAGRIQPAPTNGLRLWIAAALVLCLPERAGLLGQVPIGVWWLTAAAALFGPVFSRLLLMMALRSISAAECTLVTLVAPVAAFALGSGLLGEHPTVSEIGGSLLLLAGVALPVLEHLPGRARPLRIDP